MAAGAAVLLLAGSEGQCSTGFRAVPL